MKILAMKWFAMHLSSGAKHEAASAAEAAEIAEALKLSSGALWCVVQQAEWEAS